MLVLSIRDFLPSRTGLHASGIRAPDLHVCITLSSLGEPRGSTLW